MTHRYIYDENGKYARFYYQQCGTFEDCSVTVAAIIMISVSAGWALMAGHGDLLLYERQRYDGWYNNLAHPGWGSVDSHLTRKTPPSYADGVYMLSGGDR